MRQLKTIFKNLKLILLILSLLLISENVIFAQKKFNKSKTEKLRELCINMSCDDYEKIDLLIQKGADYNKFHSIFRNLVNTLFIASDNGCIKIVSLLLNANADVNASSTLSLNEGIKFPESKIEMIDGELIISKSNPTIYALDITPLYIASSNGYLEIVKLLVNAGADINKGKSHDILPGMEVYINETPLFVAASKGHTEIVDFLINKQADVNAVTKKDGLSILYVASQKGYTNIVKLLLDANANVETQSNEGKNPLFVTSENGHMEIVRLLVEAGADVNAACTENSVTPLFAASRAEHNGIVKILLEANADVNKSEIHGGTPLMLSIILGNTELAEILINAGANTETMVHYQGLEITPLSLAEKLGRAEIISLLQHEESSEPEATKIKSFQEVQTEINTGKSMQLLEFNRGDYAKNIVINSRGSILAYNGGTILNDDGFANAKIPSKGDEWHWITNDDFLIMKIKNFFEQPDDIIAYHEETIIPIGFVLSKSNELIIVFPKEITPCSFKIIGVFEDKLIIHDRD